MSMKIPPKAAAKGGVPLPEGAKHVPGSQAYRAVQGAPRVPHKVIDRNFVADPRGGPELVAGKAHIAVRDNRSDPLR
jgi:hypothetical protein